MTTSALNPLNVFLTFDVEIPYLFAGNGQALKSRRWRDGASDNFREIVEALTPQLMGLPCWVNGERGEA
ncbi:MAG: hypothetical protein Q8L56_04750 [Rhodocyclaceae bacterium]|nr:hypothetical protein [Rhodocyclaceae bacterium]